MHTSVCVALGNFVTSVTSCNWQHNQDICVIPNKTAFCYHFRATATPLMPTNNYLQPGINFILYDFPYEFWNTESYLWVPL